MTSHDVNQSSDAGDMAISYVLPVFADDVIFAHNGQAHATRTRNNSPGEAPNADAVWLYDCLACAGLLLFFLRKKFPEGPLLDILEIFPHDVVQLQ